MNGAIADLQQARLSVAPSAPHINDKLIARAGWLATLLANSDFHLHRQKALLFAALAKQVIPIDKSIEALCYTIFARTGALPAAMHLNQLVGTAFQYQGPSLGPLSDEFAASYNAAYSAEANKLLTEFQIRTSNALSKSEGAVISAPTSAGKSFVVHQFVKSQLRKGDFHALFIVPTKALIAQVSAVYRRFAVQEKRELAVLSSVPEDMTVFEGNIVLVLTQERCVRLLSSPFAKELSFIFADEIQGLEDGDRGALLEYVLHELRHKLPLARMFAAGPFIADGQGLGKALFERECISLETQDSPVSQMVIEVTPVKRARELVLKVLNSEPSQDSAFVVSTIRSLYSRWQASQTTAIADAVEIFGGTTSSIVYAKGPGTAQNWAAEYSELFEPAKVLSVEAQELIYFVNESIHPRCSLIECLKRRIAYHHAALPDFVREEVESLFCDGDIDVLFCTSTLLEGVNLPAEKIFVVSPKKAEESLSPFEFKNLIGRAGRLDQHLCGLVYCIQTPNSDGARWLDAYRNDTRKEVKPTVARKLLEKFEMISGLLAAGQPVTEPAFEKELRSTAVILRSRHLSQPENISHYLKGKGLADVQTDKIVVALEKTAATFSVPREVVLKNPYVDPVLQNRLFELVQGDPGKWKIRRERGFATDFESVFKQLDDVFGIIDEIAPKGDKSIYRNELLAFAKLWLRGRPFREIVTRALPSKDRTDPDVSSVAVDKAIKKAMDIVTKDVAFVTAKYFAVLVEMLKVVLTEDNIEDYAMTLSLPIMLELGCSDPRALALIVACVPRAAALKLIQSMPADVEEPVVWLGVNQSYKAFDSLPSIYRKILRRIGIWT